MRKGRLISLLSLLLVISMPQSGCVRPDLGEDTTESSLISFEAGVDLISKSTLIETTTFTTGQQFKVFGRRTGEGKETPMFGNTGTLVTKGASAWTYDPHQYWYWLNLSDYYDFLASFENPSPASPQATVLMDIPGNLAVKKPYAMSDDYDLLLAGYRRKGDAVSRSAQVNLEFQHMLCAVKVIVTNESDAVNMDLTSISFNNLVVRASAKVTIDNLGQPEYSWIDTQRPGNKNVFTGNESLASGGGSYALSSYSLFIPTDLSETINGTPTPTLEDYDEDLSAYVTAAKAVLPCMEVSFTVGGEPETHYIILKDVQKSRYSTDDSISVWERGTKYVYNIDVRLDGGVVVTVVTTEWEVIKAETPGLLIE